jgi:hypothetical protein
MPQGNPAKILMEYTSPVTYYTDQVVQYKCLYAVVYDGQMIGGRDEGMHRYQSGVYYQKNIALAAAKRFNTIYRTDRFTVIRITEAEVVTESTEAEARTAYYKLHKEEKNGLRK